MCGQEHLHGNLCFVIMYNSLYIRVLFCYCSLYCTILLQFVVSTKMHDHVYSQCKFLFDSHFITCEKEEQMNVNKMKLIRRTVYIKVLLVIPRWIGLTNIIKSTF